MIAEGALVNYSEDRTPAVEHDREENALHINVDGRGYRLWTDSTGAASVALGDVARVSTPHWVIEYRGTQHLGWDTDLSENMEQVLRRLRAWVREHEDDLQS